MITTADWNGGKQPMHNHGDRDRVSAAVLRSGLLFGLGVASFVDETVFHQILHWHHFYDRSTPTVGIITDGFFHAFSWFATIAGLFLLADVRRRERLLAPAPDPTSSSSSRPDRVGSDGRGGMVMPRWWGAVLMGAGGFQLFDGMVDHKVLRIHQIRYVSNVATYDVVWIVIAAMLLLTGLLVWRHGGAKSSPIGAPPHAPAVTDRPRG